uniref:Uncharacterized protein n=1 Tax=Ananas comosus var. bracteatus TaxID=296719 RepID=A0A6V7P0K7_ANACO|nr:unnamed protein product [Ananas comosus var. bracteatus]
MLLLDSYFILFMLTIKLRKGLARYTLTPLTPNKFTEPLTLSQDDPSKFLDIIFNKDEIALDLLIFDNQVPFFVIEELFKELELDKPLHECALEFFETIHPSLPDQRQDSMYWGRDTPNARELTESATMFEKKTNGSSLDITFRRHWFRCIIGVFDIPELHICNCSSLIFHNLITFEIQSSSRGRCTMAFSALMRNLLQREEDVKLLRQRGTLASSSMADRQTH